MQSTPAPSAEELVAAIARFRGYLEVDPANPRLWINLGDLQHQSGNWSAAVECYETCLRHVPHHAIAQLRPVLATASITLTNARGAVCRLFGTARQAALAPLSRFPLSMTARVLRSGQYGQLSRPEQSLKIVV